MAARNNNYRGSHSSSKSNIHYVTEGNLCKVDFENSSTSTPRRHRRAETFSGTAAIVLLAFFVLTGWLALKVSFVGIQHFFISDQIKSIEMEEYNSRGQSRWDNEAIDEYNRLIQEKNDFAERGIIEKWTIESGSTILGSLFRLVVYLAAVAWICLEVMFWYKVGVPFLFYVACGKYRLRFPTLRRLATRAVRFFYGK